MKFNSIKHILILSSLTLGALLLAGPALGLLGPGARNSACMFSYGDNIYVLGGVMESQDQSIFSRMPLSGFDNASEWSKLPDPPQWKPMTSYNTPSQFDCVVTNAGKVFLFGNQVGFAEYDIQSKSWDATPPNFNSPATETTTTISMKNLLNQPGLRVTANINKTSIIIVSTSPPVFMRLNPSTKEISGKSINTISTGLRGFCLGVTQNDHENIVLCGGTSDNPSVRCYNLNSSTNNVQTVFLNNLPVAQEGCTIAPIDVGYMITQGIVASGQSSALLYSASGNQLKSNISSLLPLRAYSAITYISSTKTVVVYGGITSQQNVSNEIYTLEMTKDIANNKDSTGGSNLGSGDFNSSWTGLSNTVSKIITGIVSFFAAMCVLGCIIGCIQGCCKPEEKAELVYVEQSSVSVSVTVHNVRT